MPNLSQTLSSAPVSMTTATTAPHPSSVPELSAAGCEFSTAPGMVQPQVSQVNQAEECPFRGMRCTRQTHGNYDSSEMFGQAMSCYPSVASQLPLEQAQSCGSAGAPPATTSNGYQSLEDNLLPVEARRGGFEGLEAPDLLADELLPQLEAALSQQDGSNCSWTNGSPGGRGDMEDRNSPAMDSYEEEQVRQSQHTFE